MKILIVCSGNHNSGISPFVLEQGESIKRLGNKVDYFLIKGKGAFGYLMNYLPLRKTIKQKEYDLIHAHHGLSGMLSVLQRRLPVIITFHGGDIDQKKFLPISYLASKLSHKNIYVHANQKYKIRECNNQTLIPCGIDLNIFHPIEKNKARKILNLALDKKYILFSSSFIGRPEKNFSLAKKAIDKLETEVTIIELKGYEKPYVNLLFNAVDLLILTSFRETGPLVVKEAMACNCPIVSTDVGDVKEVIGDTEGCYICSYEVYDVSNKIISALNFGKRTNGNKSIGKYEINLIANKVISVYKDVLSKISSK